MMKSRVQFSLAAPFANRHPSHGKSPEHIPASRFQLSLEDENVQKLTRRLANFQFTPILLYYNVTKGQIMLSYRSDAIAVSLSLLCLVHCLALPLLASTLPLLGVVSESEWLHRIFVTLAIPASIVSLVLTDCKPTRATFLVIAFIGFCFLIAGAFIESLESYEAGLTTFGSVLLAVAHLYRWTRDRKFS